MFTISIYDPHPPPPSLPRTQRPLPRRFVAVNPGSGERWVLRIHHARASDAGDYLCQVSVTPPISTRVTLLVTEAEAKVRPGTEVFLKVGSRVVLLCEVQGCPYPALPTWYKGQEVLEDTEVEEGAVLPPLSTPFRPPTSSPEPVAENMPSPSGRQDAPQATDDAAVSTSPTPSSTTTPTPVGLPIARAVLTRPRASPAHAGVYTCTSTCTAPINLTLHVLVVLARMSLLVQNSVNDLAIVDTLIATQAKTKAYQQLYNYLIVPKYAAPTINLSSGQRTGKYHRLSTHTNPDWSTLKLKNGPTGGLSTRKSECRT
ncbi:hemicentin-2-like [Penaeus chinensis]|uniref:hemicentin-2-like n=1 Tax=Penaeus chinensis TaxID=139456 RepID=UPI001FB6DED9|nr:hemicentin-2-like [Penaeus chinensis]